MLVGCFQFFDWCIQLGVEMMCVGMYMVDVWKMFECGVDVCCFQFVYIGICDCVDDGWIGCNCVLVD